MKFSPVTKKRIKRFKSIKRGYYSFIVFAIVLVFTLFAELFINNRALYVKYEGKSYFPTYGAFIPGSTFGQKDEEGNLAKFETNYRKLQERFKEEGGDNYVVMPFLSHYNAREYHVIKDQDWPYAPSDEHILGTDANGRDIVALVVYGFRIAFLFSLAVLVVTYSVGIVVGCLMGYIGGWFDIMVHRLIEIWSNVPYLYAIIFVSALLEKSFTNLFFITVFFQWMSMTMYMRSTTYKEKGREYVQAAKSIGASNMRIVLRHVLPNAVSVIVTFIPFTLAGGMGLLTALDYLGFGLDTAKYPSWGDLLSQAREYLLDAYWIGGSVVVMMVIILSLVTFIGEAVREAYDPKKHTYYE